MEIKTTRYVVYCITNQITGMKYIGKTHYGLTTRWNRHKREALKDKPNCTYLCRSIRKYGYENFTIEEIDTAEDRFKLIELETFYIIKHNTLSPNGYNLKLQTENSVVYSPETIEKFRQNFYKNHYEYTQTVEYKELQSRLKQGQQKTLTKQFIGVFWAKDKNRWMVRLGKKNLGYYDNEITAAEAYDYAVMEKYGPQATFNFPNKKQQYVETLPPTKRIVNKNGRFLGVVRREKNKWTGWLAVALIGENQRKTKIFSDKKYQDAELSAHEWRTELLTSLGIDNKT